MAIQQESLFETPLAHETSHYSNPYSTPEFEDETSHYSNPYTQPEFEDETSHYSNPYSTPEFEDETSHYSNPYSSPEGEAELESILHSANPEGILGTIGNVLGSILGESEVMHELEAMSNPEFEDEADQFFGKIKRLVKRAGSLLKPLARRFLPIVAKTLGGMIPGVGAIAGPLAGQLVGRLVREAEQEVAQMEQHFANALAQTGELEHPEVHEAMLTELMAAQAAGTQSEAEAEALLSAIVPMTLSNMRALRSVLPVTPALVQANTRWVRAIHRQGPQARQLLRLNARIMRLAVAILRNASRIQRLTSPMAVQALGIASQRVMGNPRQVQRSVQRNIAVQLRAQSRPRGTLPLRTTPRRRRVPTYR